MTGLALAVPILSILLLAAHSLRAGDHGLVAGLLLMLVLVPTRRSWLRYVLMGLCLASSATYVAVGRDLVLVRTMMRAPYERLAIIMIGVVLFGLTGAALLATERAKRFFHKGESGGALAAAFALTVVLLDFARSKASLSILLLDRFAPGWGRLEIALAGLYALFVCGMLLDKTRIASLRPRFWALFSAAFFLQLGLGLVGFEDFLMTGRLHFPIPALIVGGPILRGAGFFMLFLFAGSLLLAGPAWCSRLCYIGAWDDRLSRLSPKKPSPLPRSAWIVRLGLLGLVVGAALLFRRLDTPTGVLVWVCSVFGIASLAVMALGSGRSGRMVHCSGFCPLGPVANLAGKIAPWRLRASDACTGCGRCVPACRYGALSKGDSGRIVVGRNCTLCLDCLGACRHGALDLTALRLKPRTAFTIFTVATSALMAAFLACARI